MEPIVSPWIIYLLYKIDVLRGFLGIPATIILVITGVISFVGTMDNILDWEKHGKKIKKIVITCVSIIFIYGIIPDKNTIIAMYAADKITYNSVQKVVNVGKDIKDVIKKDVIDIIESITKEDKKDGS